MYIYTCVHISTTFLFSEVVHRFFLYALNACIVEMLVTNAEDNFQECLNKS